jgi:hypothetical protein
MDSQGIFNTLKVQFSENIESVSNFVTRIFDPSLSEKELIPFLPEREGENRTVINVRICQDCLRAPPGKYFYVIIEVTDDFIFGFLINKETKNGYQTESIYQRKKVKRRSHEKYSSKEIINECYEKHLHDGFYLANSLGFGELTIDEQVKNLIFDFIPESNVYDICDKKPGRIQGMTRRETQLFKGCSIKPALKK